MPQRLYTRPLSPLRLRRSLGLAITGAGSLLWLGQLALGDGGALTPAAERFTLASR